MVCICISFEFFGWRCIIRHVKNYWASGNGVLMGHVLFCAKMWQNGLHFCRTLIYEHLVGGQIWGLPG